MNTSRMIFSSVWKISNLRFIIFNQQNNYATVVSAGGTMVKAKKKLGKLGAAIEKKILPVETDTEKLVNYVCGSNINKEGEDIKLKPDSEYPDWLWSLYTGPPKRLEEMEPNSKEYWIKVKKMAMVHNNKLTKLKKF